MYTQGIDFGEKWIRQYDDSDQLEDDLVGDMHDLYYHRGCCFLALGRLDDALADLDRCALVVPRCACACVDVRVLMCVC